MISINDDAAGRSLVDEVSEFFSPEGALSSLKHFEYRAEQQQMAVSVAEALMNAEPLVVEAGTGVGKSLAYLVPAVLLAKREKRKAVITTHTINLQEQLILKDIPLLQSVLGDAEGAGVRAVLMKGRRNYVCPTRLRRALAVGDDLFTSSDRDDLKAIEDWCKKTKDGSRSDMNFDVPPRVWAQVCSEPHICTLKTCGGTKSCFYQEVRKQVAAADLVVMNHTLFFTLLAAQPELVEKGTGTLFPNDFVIFDEAHTLESVAAKQLGLNVTQAGLRFELHRLYNPRNHKGLFKLAGDMRGIEETAAVLGEMDDFFMGIESECGFHNSKPWEREFRVRNPELVENTLAEGLRKIRACALEAADRDEKESAKLELQDLARRMAEAREAISAFLDQSAEGHVYWVEQGGINKDSVSLNAAPIDVAERLRPIFFENGKSCVVTSATLGIGDKKLEYFQKRVGAEQCTAVQIGSPFDYAKQMKVHLVRSMPAPGETGYDEALVKWIRHFVAKSQGRAFILFTSWKLLNMVADSMEAYFSGQGWDMIVQGRGGSRRYLLEQFRENESSVLLGTDSFWTGVDVPGEALENVIITRLPFAVPSHPLTAARMEAIEDEGGSAFMEYSLPEAILKLRQGAGRLIRSQDDSGMVVILDNRVLSKRYGSAFLKALPEAPIEVSG